MSEKPTGPIKIRHLNSSLKKQGNTIQTFFVNQISLCILSETWFTTSDLLSIPNYRIERQDRKGCQKGGGLLIACHCSIPYERLNLDGIPVNNEELIAIRLPKLTRNNEDIILVGMYNPPKYNIGLQCIKSIGKLGDKVLIMGDLNAHNPIWLSMKYNTSGEVIEQFLEEEEFLLLNDDSPTFQSHSNADYQAILDLAMCSESLSHDILDCKVFDFSFSDHNSIIVEITSLNPPKFEKISKTIKKNRLGSFQKILF